GAGGDGGDGAAGVFGTLGQTAPGGAGGAAIHALGDIPSSPGGGGGGAGADVNDADLSACGGGGGDGGGVLVLRARSLVNRGRIAADGVPGQRAGGRRREATPGGGGAGTIRVHVDTISNLGLLTAFGGDGGDSELAVRCEDTAGAGAGGGGGGFVYLDVPSVGATDLSRITVAGGAGGAGNCSAEDGAGGEDGVVCCLPAQPGCQGCAVP
ncbi:MAG: hypothetical protein ACFCGT_20195, partial [Sandaracinaceae bacterium]